jgi:hypothetical protein
MNDLGKINARKTLEELILLCAFAFMKNFRVKGIRRIERYWNYVG